MTTYHNMAIRFLAFILKCILQFTILFAVGYFIFGSNTVTIESKNFLIEIEIYFLSAIIIGIIIIDNLLSRILFSKKS